MNERAIALESMKAVVKYAQQRMYQRNGEHDGKVFRMSNAFGAQRLTVIAEIKGAECWRFRVFMNEFEKITINAAPKVIEIDPSCHSIYIRFKAAKVHRTISDPKPGPVVAYDLDARGRVIGIELIGVDSFSIKGIRRQLPDRFKDLDLDQAEFMPTSNLRHEPMAA